MNGKFDVELDPSVISDFDLVIKEGGLHHILQNNQSYHAYIQSINTQQKKVVLTLNGQLFQVDIADAFDQLVDKMGLSATVIHKISEIRAPMPGLVLDIAVEPGQTIVHGDTLLILEAMKMENVIKSPGEGMVKAIHTDKGKAVEKGEILIELE
ncbi:MAG: acetyl-CoA carboxylase biotin carboxyl carrier protein subunit [Lewinellaceae bacterium]|nr:acetyl-CoA carboxylase biotin carboxyl carrier protein subunit [Lewinellaceae bacterium]